MMLGTQNQMVAGIAVLSMTVYATTRYRGVPGGDSGELMAMACAGGVPHPPGYPLLTMMGRLWLRATPSVLGSPASRLSLLSCVFGSMSAAMFYLTAEMCAAPWEAFLATSFFAFSPLTWTYSTQFEVFSLNNLFSSSLLYLSVRYLESTEAWIPFVGAFLCGLGLSNQHTIALLLIPLILGVLCKSGGSLLKPQSMISLLLLLALGLLPYLYLPLAAATPPLGSWGGQDTWEGFLRHFLRKEYGTFQLYTTGSPTGDEQVAFDALSNLRRQTWYFAKHFSSEGMLAAPLLCVLGAAELRRSKPQVGALLLASFLVYVVVFHSLANLPDDAFYRPILSRFWIQPSQLVFLPVAPGLRLLLRLLDSRRGAELSSRAWLGPLLCSSIAAAHIAAQWPACNNAANAVIDTFARDQLAAIPRHALALCSGDLNYYPLLYLQHCEGMRRDVLPLNTAMIKGDWFTAKQSPNYPNVSFPGQIYAPAAAHCTPAAYNARCLLDANLKRDDAAATPHKQKKKKGKKKGAERSRRVVLLRKWPPGDASHEGAYEEWPLGLVREVVPAGGGAVGAAFEQWLQRSVAALPELDIYLAARHLLVDPEEGPGSSAEGDAGGRGGAHRVQAAAGGAAHRAVSGRAALDNWEKAAVDEYIAAHTAASKFLIAALRDEPGARGVAPNNTEVARMAEEVAAKVVAALPGQAVPLKNLGALHQHLMNVVVGEGYVPGGGHAGHMGKMVAAYERFVAVATMRGDDDPDIAILRDWTAQVRSWMKENGLLHHVPSGHAERTIAGKG